MQELPDQLGQEDQQFHRTSWHCRHIQRCRATIGHTGSGPCGLLSQAIQGCERGVICHSGRQALLQGMPGPCSCELLQCLMVLDGCVVCFKRCACEHGKIIILTYGFLTKFYMTRESCSLQPCCSLSEAHWELLQQDRFTHESALISVFSPFDVGASAGRAQVGRLQGLLHAHV